VAKSTEDTERALVQRLSESEKRHEQYQCRGNALDFHRRESGGDPREDYA
jgi:hypothetical protein